ncbi:N6-adenosine-methyltransferase subunit mettl14 [Tieghemiomyces parasiticus]|uniref:N6-adenosine-methyltransferase subunit mettl14 n=1 Tax=Tieghemiomyces parasiticus TaxID=78921 RepID=A0A9W8A0Q3_9FUNG|nr:N6-adenosine-methyltransferase subunit mettl14 [Tieghemiomyces parasiticus]
MDNIGNDYASHFAQTRSRPQNYITDGDPATRFVEYPKLHELVRRKDALVAQRATPAMTLRTDLRQFPLASLGPRFFDVIVIDPPWKEYYDRACGVAKGTEVGEDPDAPPPSTPAGEPYWTWEDMAKLAIPDVAASPSFVFLWVGDGEGLDQGRKLLLQWGYRRCEDIVWVKTNKITKRAATRPPGSVLERTKEHCLMGIKGTARRSTDAHFIHCNVDTDVIVAEEFEPGSTRKPDELFDIIEHFCLGRRRLYLFGEDHNVRPGWVTAGLGLTTSTYDAEQYHSLFCGPSSHLLGQDREIDSLRPKSPVGRDSQAAATLPLVRRVP